MTFFDSVSGLPLFVAPMLRSTAAFLAESGAHGWPSFRQAEVVWSNVVQLDDGEIVSTTGTHLGHNLPDEIGDRYCINLASVLPIARLYLACISPVSYLCLTCVSPVSPALVLPSSFGSRRAQGAGILGYT